MANAMAHSVHMWELSGPSLLVTRLPLPRAEAPGSGAVWERHGETSGAGVSSVGGFSRSLEVDSSAEDGVQATCAACPELAVQLHHVVYIQHLRRHGGDPDDKTNLLPLCFRCHERHHTAARRLLLSCLRDENFAFARELLGLAAYDYFNRRYFDDGDVRLDKLLDEREVA